MATFKEFMRVAEITTKDKTSKKRMKEIIAILHKHKATRGLTPDKAVAILQDLGPTFVKVGQMASNRSDVLPREYCEAFEKLRDNVTPLAYETVLQCIDESYGHSWQEVFSEIDVKPLGSASIAQVHKGTLTTGETVAIKVRRPGIVKEMAEDIMLMQHALALVEFSTVSHKEVMLNLDGFVAELERTTSEELDFTTELHNLVRFHKEIRDQKGVSSPIPYPQFSNDAVLVMEFVEGTGIADVKTIKAKGYNIDKLAERLAQSYVTQVIDDGFFHADPHPGNIIVRNGTLMWIDLGMTGTLASSERVLVGRVFHAVATQNTYELKDAILGLTDNTHNVNQGLLMDKLGSLVSSYSTANLADLNVGAVFQEVIEILRNQQLIVKPSVTMLVRGFVTIEGVLAEISPSTSVLDIVTKHVAQSTLNADHFSASLYEMFTSSVESAEALTRLPYQLSNSLDMLDRGQINLKMDATIPHNALATIYASAGRLALALISAGLFLGSSILCTTDMTPRLLEVPILGVLGFIGAFVLGVYVIWRTLADRHRLRNDPSLKI